MAKKKPEQKEWADDVKERATSRVAKLAADIAARGGHIDGNGNLIMPMTGKQTLTGFNGEKIKSTLSEDMKAVIDCLLDKREALENVKNAVEDAVDEVEEQMNIEGLKSVVALDKHNKKFLISLKPGKTKLEVKSAK